MSLHTLYHKINIFFQKCVSIHIHPQTIMLAPSLICCVHCMISLQPAVTNIGKHLDGSEFRTFFVSWENDVISIGDGPVPAGGSFLSYKALNPFPIRGLAVATKDWQDITWEFSQIAGRIFEAWTLRHEKHGGLFAGYIFNCVFLKVNIYGNVFLMVQSITSQHCFR